MSSFTEHGTLKNFDYDQLLERVQQETENWIPEPGDVLAGTIVEVSSTDGGYGLYPIVVVATKDGKTLAFHAYHTVAKNEVARQRPAPGDAFACKYFGKGVGRDGKTEFYKYRVIVEKAVPEEQQVNWDAIGSHAATEAAELGISDPPPDPGPAKTNKKKTTSTGQTDDIPF